MKAIKAMRQAAVTVTAAVALALTGCTGQEDFIDGGDTPAQGVTLTMTASTGVENPDGTRANLTESDGKNPWLWEKDDNLLVVDASGKALGTLTLKEGIDKEKGVFEGPVNGLTAGKKVRIFYLGPNTNTSRIVNGKIMFDFSTLNGKRESLKSLCALNAEGTVKIDGNKAGILGDVTLKNAFAAAHFSVKGNGDTRLGNKYQKLVVHGDVPLQATVNAASGDIENTVMAGRESNVRSGFVFTSTVTDAPFDIYLPLVPNEAATDKATISFDIYTDKQTSKEIVSAGAEQSIVGNNADAFVRKANGTLSEFTVSKYGTKVNFTDGNLQYMMPKQVYSLSVRKHIKPNTLYRKGKDQPLALEAKYNVLKGYYRLAPEQWIMVPPTNTTTKNGYFGEYTCVQDNNGAWNVSCTDNPVFDMFFFGKPEQPTLVDTRSSKYFLPTKSTEYKGTDNDWTKYAMLSDSNDPLVTLSLIEWQYLFDYRKFPDVDVPAFALAFLDLNGNGKVEPDADQAGVVIFPDGMDMATAKSLFTKPDDNWTFGKNRTLTTYVPTGNGCKILKMEAVTKKGCLFLPFPGWNTGYNGGKCKIEQIGRHFNYWTSTSNGGKAIAGNVSMFHYNINMDGVFASTDGINGNAVRLVRFVN